MELIVISGKAHSVGKTTLAGLVIRNLGTKVGAIKTSLHDVKEYVVTDEVELIEQTGTDTAHFAESGAAKVVYILCDYAHLHTSLHQAMEMVGEVDYLVVEGNSVLDYLNPDLIFYVERTGYEKKPSALKAEVKADVLVDADEFFAALQETSSATIIPFKINAKKITCQKAHLIAKTLGIDLADFGKRLNETGIKVSQCQLGLFR